ncbi:unnamed protein product [Anisakis simplex]|uniref:Uncharacterized protein n=1 Tax=Anisakis simplex TaxID=6269 RepID=A0A0M3JMS6_ANISI|nr:unnamed protein product [Anisakis simplex]
MCLVAIVGMITNGIYMIVGMVQGSREMNRAPRWDRGGWGSWGWGWVGWGQGRGAGERGAATGSGRGPRGVVTGGAGFGSILGGGGSSSANMRVSVAYDNQVGEYIYWGIFQKKNLIV